MVRVTIWPQLLLVVLILRQSAAVSDQCSELQEEISGLERHIVSITELKHKNELRAGNCDEHLTKEIPISEATSKEFNKTEALNNYLTIQLEVKEIVLNSINEKLTQLQTTIDGLTKTVESLNERSQVRCGLPEFVCRSLLDAAKSGDVDSARRFVKCFNDSCTDDDVNHITPLLYAATYGHVEVVWMLLEGGANVDRADGNRNVALHYTAAHGRLDVCRLLLDWGAKVDPLGQLQNTPLHHAAQQGHLSVVKLLVERGADVSVKDVSGDTPLHWAAQTGQLSVVKLLVEMGADVSVKNVNGQTPSDVARINGKNDVADWLDSLSRG